MVPLSHSAFSEFSPKVDLSVSSFSQQYPHATDMNSLLQLAVGSGNNPLEDAVKMVDCRV